MAQARDMTGHPARAAATIWVTRQGEVWFGGDNQDRMDVIPEQRYYEPGQTARFQVRSPFRHATALVAVERNGEIVPKSQHHSTKLSSGDRLEIVIAVGGG